MSAKQFVKRYWRITLAVLLVVASVGVIFGVGGIATQADANEATPDAAASDSSMTTLKFGLELSGGTRIKAPLYGATATGVEVSSNTTETDIRNSIASGYDGVQPFDINLYQQNSAGTQYTVEVTGKNASVSKLKSALESESMSYEEVRSGVTKQTRQQTVRVINSKINEGGLTGGTARVTTTQSGQHYVLIEIPSQDRSDVIEMLDSRGSVRIDIYYPTTTDSGNRTYKTMQGVLTQNDFQRVGSAQDTDRMGPHVPVTLRQSSAEDFRQSVMETGLTSDNARPCRYEEAPKETGPCLLTKVDGNVVYSAGISPSLADSIESGEWVKSPQFVLQTNSMDKAQSLALNLRAGALPTALNFDESTIQTVSASQGEQFKQGSVLIGIAALIGVSLVVFFRYRDFKVAFPMVLASLSEVIILAALAALIGYPIDLAVIGGFIAVIGTGVDDLIIVANEIFTDGETSSSQRIFKDRFRKALWVIGAAAVTTIVALSPIVAFGIGQLTGFAIFTIIGILIGVFITRPAYGDFLRILTVDR